MRSASGVRKKGRPWCADLKGAHPKPSSTITPLTLVFPYYENPLFLQTQAETWRAYPADLLSRLTVTFYVGYEYAEDVPADLKQAIVVTVGELYKSPDLSNADGLEPNVLSVAHFWPRRWSNAF